MIISPRKKKEKEKRFWFVNNSMRPRLDLKRRKKKIENVCFLLLARYNVTSYNSQKNVYTYIYTLKYTHTHSDCSMGSQPTLVINFFAYFIPFYFISNVFESKLLFSLAFCLHFKNGYLVVWNRYDISHFPKCGWKDRRMDGCFFS